MRLGALLWASAWRARFCLGVALFLGACAPKAQPATVATKVAPALPPLRYEKVELPPYEAPKPPPDPLEEQLEKALRDAPSSEPTDSTEFLPPPGATEPSPEAAEPSPEATEPSSGATEPPPEAPPEPPVGPEEPPPAPAGSTPPAGGTR